VRYLPLTMKQRISVPAAIAVAVVVLGGIGFFLWRHSMVSSYEKPVSAATVMPSGPAVAGGMSTREAGYEQYNKARAAMGQPPINH